MFPRTIKKRQVFLLASKSGSVTRTKNIVTVCLKHETSEPLVGYTASRRIGGAVSRNYARRRLRSLVQEFCSEFVPGFVFVFIATRGTVESAYSALKTDFVYSFRKAFERESEHAC